MLTGEIVHVLDRAAATYAASQSDPIAAYQAYLAGALAALRQIRADLLAMPRHAPDDDARGGPRLTETNSEERSLAMHTIPTVTDEQIRALRDAAAAAGDLAQVMICDRALGEYEPLEHATEAERALVERFGTPAEARAECARVIADARARQD